MVKSKKNKTEKASDEFFTGGIAKNIIKKDVPEFVEGNYLPFAWSVCLDRALALHDGLKPIQRRVLFTAYKNGITDKSAKMKSATFDGKVLEFSPHGGCLAAETMLYTVEYGSITIGDLYKKFESGLVDKVKTVSVDESTGTVTFGEISDVWITKYVDTINEIALDDHTVVRCTPNHPFMLDNKKFVPAEELKFNDKLRNYSVIDNNLRVSINEHNCSYSFSRDNADSIVAIEQDSVQDTVTVISNETVTLDVSIPVYDFSEEVNHNALLCCKSVYSRNQDSYKAICVHNSYGSIINIAESETPGQPRDVRVPLVKIRGNAGGISSPPAASRYTELSLWPSAMELLKELDEDTVEMKPNYNNTQLEPKYLPVRWPVVFINGVPNAMAVGFACNLPCHNPDEVMDACIAYIKNPEMSNEDLHKIILGPDFNCGCDIYAETQKDGSYVDGIKQYMETGSGSFIMRARYELEEDNGVYTINYYHLPYKVSPEKVIDEFVKLYEKGELKEVASIKDLSGIENPVHLEIITKKNINISKVISELYKKTSLQSVFAANNTIVVNNTPKKCSVKEVLDSFIALRKDVTKKKLDNRLVSYNNKLRNNEAIKSVLLDLDKCISIIRNADNESLAKEQLISAFNIDEGQAQYILTLQLRKLTKADQHEIDQTISSLKKQIKEIKTILSNDKKFINFIVSELEDTKKVISSPRKCKLYKRIKSSDTEDKDVFLVLSNGKAMRTFEEKKEAFKVDSSGKVLVVTKDKAFIRSVYDLNDNKLCALSRFKTNNKALTVSASEGYLILVGSEGNMKAVDMSSYKIPRKESVDKILGQPVVFAEEVKKLSGVLVVNGEKSIKIEDLPVQGIGANGRKMFKGTVESVKIK